MPKRPLKKAGRQLQRQKQYQKIVNIIKVMQQKPRKQKDKATPRPKTGKDALLSPEEAAQKAAIARYERNIYFSKLNDTSRQQALMGEVSRLQQQLQNIPAVAPMPAAAPAIIPAPIIPAPAPAPPAAPPLAPLMPWAPPVPAPVPLRLPAQPVVDIDWPMVPMGAPIPGPQMPDFRMFPDLDAFAMPRMFASPPSRRRAPGPISFPKLELQGDDDTYTDLTPMDSGPALLSPPIDTPLPPPAPARAQIESTASSSRDYPVDIIEPPEQAAPAEVERVTRADVEEPPPRKKLSRTERRAITNQEASEFLKVIRHADKDAKMSKEDTIQLAAVLGVNFTDKELSDMWKAGKSYVDITRIMAKADGGKFVRKVLDTRAQLTKELGPSAAGIRGIMNTLKKEAGLPHEEPRKVGRPTAAATAQRNRPGSIVPPPPQPAPKPAGIVAQAKKALGFGMKAHRDRFAAFRGTGIDEEEGLTDADMENIIHNISRDSPLRRAYQGIVEPADLSSIKISRTQPSAFIIFEEFDDAPNEGHWTALWVDPLHSIEYFNSFGEEPSDELAAAFGKLIKRNRLGGDNPIKLKTNGLVRQSANSSNCGFFAIDFLDKRAKAQGDGAFAEASGFNSLLRKVKAAGFDITGDSEQAIEIKKRKFSPL